MPGQCWASFGPALARYQPGANLTPADDRLSSYIPIKLVTLYAGMMNTPFDLPVQNHCQMAQQKEELIIDTAAFRSASLHLSSHPDRHTNSDAAV